MNYDLPFLPERPAKPRQKGVNMIMDKGLSIREAEDLVSRSGHLIDLLKLGFGTSIVTPDLERKIEFYRSNDIDVYVGGTLFEAFYIRGMLDEFVEYVKRIGANTVEVSDGSMVIPHKQKCQVINQLSKDFKVLSEVGSKEEGILISPKKWIQMMRDELDAGSWKVIAEARESGTVGIYRPNGTAHTILINKILSKVDGDDILWEAPKKAQQVWFIKYMGPNVNLGNIAPSDVISLECLRLGLRGDTFFEFLPADVAEGKRQENPKPAKKKAAPAKEKETKEE
ncbi:phosphosulfolactate synthase [Sanyastnella coralliicola]|uniref:phosphosulfolactate synthase n=1 Tax=Sanyastnella coralliicola TaxID=3069118 RepID=UPI0027BA4926|nr:phosphosulfolactate synthase [Longitalea sp. SCSIO 12813]